MNGNCLDIGIIQAFLDSELDPETTVKVSHHIASCDRCSAALAQADEENSQVFSVLDREMNTLVPTQRLWARINDTIAEERGRVSIWRKIAAFISLPAASPSFAAAAGIILAVGVMFVIWDQRSGGPIGEPGPSVATVTQSENSPPAAELPAPVTQTATSKPSDVTAKPTFTTTDLSATEIKRRVVHADYRVSGREPVRAVPASTYLPGEESYIRTINELQGGPAIQNTRMDASSQVAFQRDLAVVDNSIARLRDVVRKDPKNQAARQVLYSSYQDKIELLKSAAQRDELMASLQ